MRPATIKQDRDVYRLWHCGTPPKVIMSTLHLTKDQVYKGLGRESKKRNKAKKGER